MDEGKSYFKGECLLEETLDLKELLLILYKRLPIIIGGSLLGMVLAFVISFFVLTPKYTSSVSMYVNNSTEMVAANAVNINDINAAQKLVNTYIVILQDDEVMEQVAALIHEEYSDSDYTAETLRKIVKMTSVNNTEVLNIEATTPDPELSAALCNLITEVAPDVLQRVVKAGSVEVIGTAKPAEKPSSPNIPLNTAVGLLLGIVVSVFLVLFLHMLDNTVKSEEELKKRYDIPVLGEVPDFTIPLKGEYKSYGSH